MSNTHRLWHTSHGCQPWTLTDGAAHLYHRSVMILSPRLQKRLTLGRLHWYYPGGVAIARNCGFSNCCPSASKTANLNFVLFHHNLEKVGKNGINCTAREPLSTAQFSVFCSYNNIFQNDLDGKSFLSRRSQDACMIITRNFRRILKVLNIQNTFILRHKYTRCTFVDLRNVHMNWFLTFG